jgi:hypothetical protein
MATKRSTVVSERVYTQVRETKGTYVYETYEGERKLSEYVLKSDLAAAGLDAPKTIRFRVEAL